MRRTDHEPAETAAVHGLHAPKAPSAWTSPQRVIRLLAGFVSLTYPYFGRVDVVVHLGTWKGGCRVEGTAPPAAG